MRSIAFAKGHGTRNDFVLFIDRDGLTDLSAREVSYLCDRRAGVGGDGILRAVEADLMSGYDGPSGLWFMDYRNADGSIAEMCGNGLRVFLRYLAEEDLIDATAPVTVATRAGLRTGRFLDGGLIAVTMGAVANTGAVQVSLGERTWPAVAVNVGNPHAVVTLEPTELLADLNLDQVPTWSPSHAFPDGVNVEFITIAAPGRVRMRVHERGVGETQSCGTGVVAAASVAAPGGTCSVSVPGGELQVDLTGSDAVLVGPAEVVARGRCYLPSKLV
jgi:diaminopimelate epimerase